MNQESSSELAEVRELHQKVSLIERINAGAEFIVEPEVLTNYRIIQNNVQRESFDTGLASQERIEGEAGGSVATEYTKQRELHPTAEPLVQLLLGRRRALRKADVSPKNRQPRGWELPIRFVGGYTKRLPKGYKRRPTAEQEAREYFTSIGLAFDGLPEGKNFVGEYKRGTLPADTPFRLARFRPETVTRAYLGSLGITGRRPPKRPDRKGKKKKRK